MIKYFNIQYLRNLFEIQTIRFLVIGAINTAFGFAVFSVMMLAGVALWQALVGSTLAGIIFNFFTYGSVVFRQLSYTRLPRFVLAYLFILSVNAWLIEYISRTYETGKILAGAYVVIPMAIVSYLILNNFVFRKTRGLNAEKTSNR
jgi:putative flippase GtrA